MLNLKKMKKILVMAVTALFIVSINAQTATPAAASKVPAKMEAKHANVSEAKKMETSKPAHVVKSKMASAKKTKVTVAPEVKADVKK